MDNEVDPLSEYYRNQLATVDEDGKRKWVYAKKPSGTYYKYRSIVAYILLTFLFAGPFIKINGNPFLMFNVLERKFVIFGNVFYPQDFYIFMFSMAVGVIAIGIFTLVFGRLFCGWVCPQTIFMEMIFRKIEYWIEGDWNKQKALDKAEMSPSKLFKKVLKHSIFFVISFFISNIFLAYIIGIDALIEIVMAPPSANLGGFISIMIFALIFYIVFARLREQICTTVCPYGRLQGVLLDKHSVVVAYDYKRGENRGRFRKHEERAEVGKGDCVDCNQCVRVCPTGIDIRNGTQLECIHCTACIDACNSIMEKLEMDTGLIRYTSEHHIENNTQLTLNRRTVSFSVLLSGLVVVIFGMLFFRNKVEITVLRTPNTLFQERKGGVISNLFNYNVVNKSNEDYNLVLRLEAPKGEIQMIGDSSIVLSRNEKTDGTFFVLLDSTLVVKRLTPIQIGVYNGVEKVDEATINFLGKQ